MRHKGAYTRRRRSRGGEKRKIEQKKRGGGDRDANNCGKPVNRLVNDLNYDYGRWCGILGARERCHLI